MTHLDQFITTRDRAGLHCALHASHQATTGMILVHSLAMDHGFWHEVVEALPEDLSVLTYDARGHGTSDKPPGPYRVEQFADDLADLMDAIGWTDAVVAGASMGGCVALAFTGRHPERVRGLGLVDTTAWYGNDAPTQWADRAAKAVEVGLKSMVEFQTTRWFGDAFRQRRPEIVQRCVDVFLKNDPHRFADTCEMLGACDLRDVMTSIRVPTAIVVGAEDYATPLAMAEALNAGIAGSTLKVIAGGRHLTPLEFPSEIASMLTTLARGEVE